MCQTSALFGNNKSSISIKFPSNFKFNEIVYGILWENFGTGIASPDTVKLAILDAFVNTRTKYAVGTVCANMFSIEISDDKENINWAIIEMHSLPNIDV